MKKGDKVSWIKTYIECREHKEIHYIGIVQKESSSPVLNICDVHLNGNQIGGLYCVQKSKLTLIK